MELPRAKSMPTTSLPAERVDRIERGGLPCGVPAEANADDRADDECTDANRRRDLRERRDERVVRVDLEIIILTQLQTARDPHCADGLIERLVVGGLRGRLRRDVDRAIRRTEIVEVMRDRNQ